MERSEDLKHAAVIFRNPWFLIARLFLVILLFSSALAFLKPSAFTHTVIVIYGALGIIYFAYSVSADEYLMEFARGVVTAQLTFELLIEGLLVNHVGGSFSPFILFFLITIAESAIYFHLVGAIVVATFAGLLYSLPVFFDISYLYELLIEPPRLAGTGFSSDEAFYTVFLHLCLFYFFAFISGYLAQRLSAASIELRRLRLETGEILEQMRSGLLTVDSEGRIVYFNRAAGIILDAAPETMRGKSLEEAFGQNQVEFGRRIAKTLANMISEDRSEISITGARGENIPIGLSLSLIKDDLKNIRGLIAIFQDLTEAKKLEERLRAADRLAAVGQLAAGIAHEIRNPLASISGSVEVLKDEINPQGENLRLMELILKETSRLNTILSDFLNFARVEKGSPGRCDLAAVIPEVIDLAGGNDRIGDSVNITYRLHRQVLMIAAGEDQIRQILWNLILNSAEAMDKKGGNVVIFTEDHVDDKSTEMIKLVVSDDGPGISPGIRGKIFDPFFSTKEGGTGLGLPIVVRIVDRLGGQTELDSSPGAGTTFSIFLPRQVPHSEPVVLQEVI